MHVALPQHHPPPPTPAPSMAATSNFEIATAGRKFNCELRRVSKANRVSYRGK